MVREIDFSVNDIDKVYINSDTYMGYNNGRRLFAGYEGENEATRLSFTFGSDFSGYTITLLLTVDGTEYETSSQTDDFDYDIPTAYMKPEAVRMVIKAVSGTQILLSDEIILEIERS